MDYLSELANKYGADKGPLKHLYTPIYNEYFKEFQDKAIQFLEIGVQKGKSIKMWLDYFSNATIYGMDCDLSIVQQIHEELVEKKFSLFIGDQSNQEDLQRIVDSCPTNFDIILDDGSHYSEDQQISLAFLFKTLKSKGLYLIEDLNCHRPCKPHVKKLKIPSTIEFLEKFIKLGKIDSEVISESETIYLQENIEFCRIFSTQIDSKNKRKSKKLAIIKKK